MTVFLIRKSTMTTSRYMSTAYIDKQACDSVCKDLARQWEGYCPVEVDGTEIAPGFVLFDRHVYTLAAK